MSYRNHFLRKKKVSFTTAAFKQNELCPGELIWLAPRQTKFTRKKTKCTSVYQTPLFLHTALKGIWESSGF